MDTVAHAAGGEIAPDTVPGTWDVPVSATTRNVDPASVARDLADSFARVDAAFVLYFASHDRDPAALAAALHGRFGPVPCIGCTTSGEITAAGYDMDSVTAIAFPRRHFRLHCHLFTDLCDIVVSDCMRAVRAFGETVTHQPGWTRLGLLLVDGVSRQEEVLIASVDAALPGVPIVGGSAGDGLDFRRTFVFHDGKAHDNAALLSLIETDYRITEICIDHFEPTGTRMVVTCADPMARLVHEINAEPAAEAYAHLVGVRPEDLTPFIFASNPLLVRAGGRYHVRSIQQVVAGQGLQLLSAIEEGVVLTLGRAQDIADRLDSELSALPRAPDLLLGLDCILRRLDIERLGLTERISQTLRANNVIGFSTYGEQHHGMHVNQTFVGVAFFATDGD